MFGRFVMYVWFHGCTRFAATSLPTFSIVGKNRSHWIVSFCTLFMASAMPANCVNSTSTPNSASNCLMTFL